MSRRDPFHLALPLLASLWVMTACSNEAPSPQTDPLSAGDTRAQRTAGDGLPVDFGPTTPPECTSDGACAGLPGTAPPCRPAACEGGRCVPGLPSAPTGCDDGDPCTVNDRCGDGACVPGPVTPCDDDNPCTADNCDTETGSCAFEAVDTPCEASGSCAIGVCHGGACEVTDALFARELPAPRSLEAVALVALDTGHLAIIAHVALPQGVTGVVWLRASLDGAVGAQVALPLVRAAGGAAGQGGLSVVVGERRSEAGDEQGAVIGVTPGGSLAWERSMGGKKDERLLAVSRRAKGGWTAVGQTFSKGQGGGDIWYLRLNPKGYPLLDWSYGTAQVEEATAVTTTSDDGAIIAGRQVAPDGEVKALMIRVAPDASLKWYAAYGGPGDERPAALSLRPNDGALLAGTRAGPDGGQVAWLLAVDDGGKVLWERLEPGAGVGMTLGAEGDGQGGIWAVGARRPAGETGAPWTARAARHDAAGKLLWARTYLPLAEARLVAVRRVGGGAFVLGDRRIGGLRRLVLLRLDGGGSETCDVGAQCGAMALQGCDDEEDCTVDACHATGGCAHHALPDGSACAKGACAAGKCVP